MEGLVELGISLTIVIAIMLVTELISALTHGKIPQMFLMALFFMVGFWIGLPKDIIEKSHLLSISDITRGIILIHIATVFDFKALRREWRVAVTSLAAMAGITVAVFAVCGVFFTTDYAVASIPPLMGGTAAALLMLETAPTHTITLLVLLVWVLQAFIGYPLASMCVRREGKRLCDLYRQDPAAARRAIGQSESGESGEEKKVRLIDKVPAIIKTPTFIIFQMLILALLSAGLATVFSMVFHTSADLSTAFSIALGLAARSLGILDQSPLDKAQSSGILFIALYASLMVGFAECTPQQVLSLLAPIAVILVVATIGILVVSIPVGRKMGYSTAMSAAIGLNCFLGFPVNYAITGEQIALLSRDEGERKYLNDAMMSKMIVAGITAVSIVSCIVASVFMNMFQG